MNRLAHETSPYLRQHADNPVDWYPWGEEALAEAAHRDRPILLSVGYSSCHWCHVMAHESFEDPAIAAEMNRHFVNVKVDREERPDLDAIYMDAVQALTGQGGWPMTVFLFPDGRPFFAGTYFPPEDRGGMPGFGRILAAITDIWEHRRDDVDTQADQLIEAIRSNTLGGQAPAEAAALQFAVLDAAAGELSTRFDRVHGGFGPAPKFPPAMTLDFLMRTHVRQAREADGADPALLEMVTVTLDAMAAGGIYDQVGGGFARYSTDAVWLVPHFEKMLYDQALLVGAYLRGYLLTGTARYREVVEETIAYVLRDLRHPAGGFYCAEDADSEGIEGKFYLWTPDEIRAVCGRAADAVIAAFGVTDAGNFRDPHTGHTGSILYRVDRHAALSAPVADARERLRAARAERVRPGLDDKVLTAWNALFTRALIEAAAAFGRDDWMDAARANLRFLLDTLRRADGRLLRTWQADGGARNLAVAEDYAALTGALLTAAEFDDVTWLEDARAVAADLVRYFADPASGGVFTTGTDAEPLVVRPQDFFDNATPSENSLAADALLRLGAVTGDHGLVDEPRRLLALLGPTMAQHPGAFGFLLGAYERALTPAVEVAIVGPDRDLVATWAERVTAQGVGVRAPEGGDASLTPLLADRPYDGTTRAYVCEGFTCRAPVTDVDGLRAALDAVL